MNPCNMQNAPLSNAYSSSSGLIKVWERLQECYCSHEDLEKALFDKLKRFPRITNKDPHLSQGPSFRNGPTSEVYIPGLLHLDTARGIHPTVDKLL